MEEFHESSVVLPLGKYHSTSTIASSRLRLAADRGAVYPQSCRRERFAARRRLAASSKFAGAKRANNLRPRSREVRSKTHPRSRRQEDRQHHDRSVRFPATTSCGRQVRLRNGIFAADRRANSNEKLLSCRRSGSPRALSRSVCPIRVWNGIFAAGDRRAKKALETMSPSRDQRLETTTREKWPQKRPFC
jgi:hypothetical protein